ncbi:MAG: response regulator [Candidatus Levybacteria bacterium]|nr:response regulator [Candidatus Levybacteria bacterium]
MENVNTLKILIIEDDQALHSAMVTKLEKEGFSVISAYDGKEGLDKALSNHPDLILLDIILPVMDGMTVLEELRRDSWGRNAEVIVLSNLSGAEKDTKIEENTVRAFLVKSDWKLEDLVSLIKQHKRLA